MAHHIRKIRPDQYPELLDPVTMTQRRVYPEELINFGIKWLGGDLYDCAHIDGKPEPTWGVSLARGRNRYDQLPSHIRAQLVQRVPHRWAGE